MSAPLNAIQLSPTTALTRAASGAALGDDTRRTLHDSVASVVLPPLAGSAILESTDGADESAPVIQECEDDVVALREMPGIGASGRERLEP
ncbi:uncharacterized protein PHACADRAFT_158547 [Phanerochaete carnosa HHB-10118-sp]|uniref:Uncharacterized protein n=1 Tax=Phanerochaete carnosa (strain HHB-10118-sp) TaxID=650164 RepID=K5V4E1_PHACS|nr:uncharacterized protein PHACADRAFT_158547 [Phanerochaete carnosa HHB-10118-sp]EKM57471.1 hypothetical protein PHACADRAFT_158547 [Phanerochaete carnosa HHB-10118-sp]